MKDRTSPPAARRRRVGRRRARGALLALAAILPSASFIALSPVRAADLEYRVKAAFLYKFALFVEWPPGTFRRPRAPIRIGVLGKDPFGSVLERTVRGKRVKGRRFSIVRSNRVSDLQDCHILFISSSEERRIEKILASLESRRIVTVSDIDEFAERGGLLGFVTIKKRVRLKMNMDTARDLDLKISWKLKKVSIQVRGKGRS